MLTSVYFKHWIGMGCALGVAAGLAATAQADMIAFREGGVTVNYGGGPVTTVDATFDDATVRVSSNLAENNYNGGNLYFRGSQGTHTLIGIKDMFSLLPGAQGGQDIQINSAHLLLHITSGITVTEEDGSNPNANHDVEEYVYRTTADWMLGAAGTNEANVTAAWRDSSQSPELLWDAGYTPSPNFDGGFGTGDYDEASEVETKVVAVGESIAANDQVAFDVTSILQDIYALGDNQGFTMINGYTKYSHYYHDSEDGTDDGAYRPALVVDYEYVPEPGSLALLGLGGLALLGRRRRA